MYSPITCDILLFVYVSGHSFYFVFRKVTRSDLIAGYLGQTAIKTKKVVDECKGGVLFIDEVYALGSQVDDDNYFTKENIIELSKSNVIYQYNYIGQLLINSDIDIIGDWHLNNTKPDNYWYNKKYYGKPNIDYLDGGESYILSRNALNKIKQY